MTYNLRDCGMAGIRETLGLIPGTKEGLKSRERKYRQTTISYTLMDGQDHRKYSGGIPVKIKYVLVISHQQKNSMSKVKVEKF